MNMHRTLTSLVLSWRIRNSWYCLISRDDVQLFDLQADPGESVGIAAEHPEIVRELSAAYDRWWEEVVPLLVNEDAWKISPVVNPFREQFEMQFDDTAR